MSTFVKTSKYSVAELTALGLEPKHQAVYRFLVERSNRVGTCFPALNTIAAATGIATRTTIIKIIDFLCSVGLISRTRRNYEKGGKKSNLYSVKECKARESNPDTTYVHEIDSKVIPHVGGKKDHSDFVKYWEYNTEVRKEYDNATGANNFMEIVSRFKKWVIETYNGTDYDGLFRNWIANEIEKHNRKASKKVHTKTVTSAKKLEAEIEAKAPNRELTKPEKAFWDACQKAIQSRAVLNNLADGFDNILIEDVTVRGSRDLRIQFKPSANYAVRSAIETNKHAITECYLSNQFGAVV